tara:strand:- start:6604 stop:7197 length:594 start_codon:yes stop_codon:yes gene_type:complete
MHLMMKTLIVSVLLSLSLTSQALENPRVTFETDLGKLVIELYPKEAPITVENFLRYCNDGFYTGTIFHRIIPNFVVQGGGLTFDYVKKETREPIKNESDNGLKNRRGTLSMARLPDPDSATSQFFINLNRNRHLDPKKDEAGYAVFGQVVDGMDVVIKMTKEPRGKIRGREQSPDLPIRILAVEVHDSRATNASIDE